MTKRMVLIFTVTIAFSFFVYFFRLNIIQKNKSENIVSKVHPLVFYDPNLFSKGTRYAEDKNTIFPEEIAGGIIPHHLFPSFIIADFFHGLSQQNVDTVVLIGPNHREEGKHTVLSSFYKWKTPFGMVDVNEKIIGELEKENILQIDPDVLTQEHSIAGIMPFVKYYIPNAKVVPIILSGFMKEDEVVSFATQLSKYISQNTVLIASVDFSHYLRNQEAQAKDEITINLLEKYEYKKILQLNNDYLDSAPSIATLLLAMKEKNNRNIKILHHANSGELQKNNTIETTSYISAVFY